MSADAVQPSSTARQAEIAAGLESVRLRIAQACLAAGRDRDDVTLVVVTKTYPAGDVLTLAGLGVNDVGENRDQEAAAKRERTEGAGLRWHCIGQVQSNKVRSVAAWADVVQTIDRPRLIRALDTAVTQGGRTMDVLVQVSLDGDPDRGGCRITDLVPLAEQVVASQSLTLKGLMAVAPLGVDPRVAFDPLAGLSEAIMAIDPQARWVSAGMSADLESAVAVGATHVRVGSAVLGARPPVR